MAKLKKFPHFNKCKCICNKQDILEIVAAQPINFCWIPNKFRNDKDVVVQYLKHNTNLHKLRLDKNLNLYEVFIPKKLCKDPEIQKMLHDIYEKQKEQE